MGGDQAGGDRGVAGSRGPYGLAQPSQASSQGGCETSKGWKWVKAKDLAHVAGLDEAC